MNYTDIELNEYRRFALNEWEHFSMHITSALQLIIGTNGSGKSSLLEQLTPLPPNPAEFGKNGSKVIRFTHNHHSYVLSAVFSPKRHYSFVVDGEEKNDGGTITVQFDLVKEYFGITPEIHQLLLGRERFTQMSPARRKEWLLRLCDTNYDYAIRVYNRAREQQRDTNGALKLTKKTLVAESEKLLGDEELNRLKHEAESLHQCLNELLEYRMPVENDLDTLDFQQEQLDRTLSGLARTLLTLQDLLKDNQHTVLEYDEFIAAEQEVIVRNTALLEQASTEFTKNDEKIKLLQKAEAKSIDLLQAEVDALSAKITKLLESSLLPSGMVHASAALPIFEAMKEHLATIFTEIPENPQRQYSSQQMQIAREEIGDLTQKRVIQAELLEKTRIGVRHMEAHKNNPDLACPKCSHRFSSHYDEKRYKELLDDQEQRVALIEKKYAPRIAELELYLVRCGEYAQLYRQYVQLTGSASYLAPYWVLAEVEDLVRSNPRKGIHWMQQVNDDLLKQVEVEACNAQLKEKRELRDSLKAIGSVDLNSLLARNSELEKVLGEHTATLQKARSNKTYYTTCQQRLKQFLDLRGKIQAVIQSKRELNKETLETIRRQEVNALIRSLQSELAQREQRIGSAAQQKSIVDSLSAQIETYLKQEQSWSVLVKELSPTEGLIAEGLLGFIKNFVDQMNSLIRSVWSYPLEVQSCEAVEGSVVDLDYRFPMKIQNQDTLISDVSKGSSGMIEIIDLAFKLSAMQYLNLQDSPLYLDELGATLDAAHKTETVYIIKTLVDQQTFPQVFLISHDFHQYGALANCEIALLNDLNVVAPTGNAVNKHISVR